MQLTLQKTKDRHVLIGIDLYSAFLCSFLDIACHEMHFHAIVPPLVPLISHVDAPRWVLFPILHRMQMPLAHLHASIVLHDHRSEMPQVRIHLPRSLILIVILPLDEVMHSSSNALLANNPLNRV